MLEKQLPHAPPYQLRTNRAPRSGYGTCGSRTYSFVKQIASEAPDKRLARELDVSPHEQFDARTRACPQQEILAIQASKQEIHHVVITIKKTYSSVESGAVPPFETTLEAMHSTLPSNCPDYRLKEWTQHDLRVQSSHLPP